MSPRSVAVVVAHREHMVAEGLAAALAGRPGIVPVAAVTTSREAEQAGEAADAVALDVCLSHSTQVARELRRRGIRVVLLVSEERSSATGDEDCGVALSTRDSVAQLAAALAPGLGPAALSPSTLTQRQRQVLALVAGGLPGKQVARQLGISEKTVERHKTRIFARLGVPNQTAAVSITLRHELTENHQWNLSST